MLMVLLALLFALMVLIGGRRGAAAFGVLLLTALLCAVGVLLLSYGISPTAVLAVSCPLFIFLTILLQNGFHVKTFAAAASVLLLLIPIVAVLALICSHAHITGLDEFQTSQAENSYLSSGVQVKLGAIWLVSLVWGELGAVADASVTLASALNEVDAAHPELTRAELIRSGLQIGRGMIGATINTLVFIAFGEAVTLCLLYLSDGYSWTILLNSKSFFQQFGGILISCESCLLAMPLTAACFAWLARSKRVQAIRSRRFSG